MLSLRAAKYMPPLDLCDISGNIDFNDVSSKLIREVGQDDESGNMQEFSFYTSVKSSKITFKTEGGATITDLSEQAGSKIKVVLTKENMNSIEMILWGIKVYTKKSSWNETLLRKIQDLYNTNAVSQNRMKYMVTGIVYAQKGIIIHKNEVGKNNAFEFETIVPANGVIDAKAFIQHESDARFSQFEYSKFEKFMKAPLYAYGCIVWKHKSKYNPLSSRVPSHLVEGHAKSPHFEQEKDDNTDMCLESLEDVDTYDTIDISTN